MSEPGETPHATGRRHALEALAQHCHALLLARLEAAKAPGVPPEHVEYLRGQADALGRVADRARAG